MKLVLCYSSTDGYREGNSYTIPFNAPNKKVAILDLETLIKNNERKDEGYLPGNQRGMPFYGFRIDYDEITDQCDGGWKIYTLEEWFDIEIAKVQEYWTQ